MIHRLRLRTTLLIPLLALSFGGTVVSLLIVRSIVQQQVRINLISDLQHSVQTYQNLAQQRREMLDRESALLADLPSLKALMTGDERTIVDGGAEFWHVSGSDFFALLDRNGRLTATYNRGTPLDRATVESRLTTAFEQADGAILLAFDRRLYEVAIQPVLFGSLAHNSRLGFVAVGYAVDERVAREVSEASAADVSFLVGQDVVASTLSLDLQRELIVRNDLLLRAPAQDRTLHLGGEQYLATSIPLGLPAGEGLAPQLVVLKSFAQASVLIRRVNQWVLTLALIAILAGTGMLVSVSRTLTHPIETLVEGARALAQGNFTYRLSEDGVQEVRELSRAFERMRVELQRTQRDLLDSERLATIGRMASSISHDLRHYLSAMYANAEFLSDARLSQVEREDLFQEVKVAVQGMTDLLDSLLLFTQTGRALRPAKTPLVELAQHAAGLVRSHPAAREVSVRIAGIVSTDAWVDPRKLDRAVYNLLLNACQAARSGTGPAEVKLQLGETQDSYLIEVSDSGPGIPDSIRDTMFLPFVSEGKESGIGLGLTMAQQIAQEHGGRIDAGTNREGQTQFTITLLKDALEKLAHDPERCEGEQGFKEDRQSARSLGVIDSQVLNKGRA